MKPLFDIRYYDRKSGRIEREKVFAASFLNWSYNTRIGRRLTLLAFSRRPVSCLIGWLCRRRLSRHLIAPFVRWSQLDATHLPCKTIEFSSFRDFFIRDMKPEQRTVAGNDSVCVSPVSGKAFVLPNLKMDESVRIKRCVFNLSRLLNDNDIAQKFDGGTAVIFRLCLSDYHRIHFPVSGIPDKTTEIDGRCYAGGPYDESSRIPFYTENVRSVTTISSDRFDDIAMVEIGAFTVASIVQTYQPGISVRRGEEKGWFEPGGSTVVLVFQKGSINIDAELLKYSNLGMETRLRCGESIGQTTAIYGRKS